MGEAPTYPALSIGFWQGQHQNLGFLAPRMRLFPLLQSDAEGDKDGDASLDVGMGWINVQAARSPNEALLKG